MTRSTKAIIDLDALKSNYDLVRELTPNASLLGVVKANAYGHGMIPIARTLQYLGIDMLGVAFVDEGVALRRAGITAPILVMTSQEPALSGKVVEHDLTQVVCSVEATEHLSKAAVDASKTCDVHVFVDTGMHREGAQPDEVPSIVEAIDAMPGVNARGILTHFAMSDEQGHPFTGTQTKVFESVLAELRNRGRIFEVVHASNTGGIVQAPYAHFDMVRAGRSLYGYAAPSEASGRAQPVMSIVSKVLTTRRIAAGESVSYGQRWTTNKETTIATIPIGFGDGYLRGLTNRTSCLIHGKEYPIVGTICMDELMVDVGDDNVRHGDDVVMLGSQSDDAGEERVIYADTLAERAETNLYEITTSVSQRVPRVYVGDLASIAEAR